MEKEQRLKAYLLIKTKSDYKAEGDEVEYYYNDPATPKLKIFTPVPEAPASPTFEVAGYEGGGFVYDSTQGRAAECFVTIANSIRQIQTFTEDFQSWSVTDKLNISPAAGQDLNAYYDRYNIKLFYKDGPRLGRTIYTSGSPDIIAHELGHAILDAIKPRLWNEFGYEPMAFHESFADINAALAKLYYPAAKAALLQRTRRDLSRSNFLSKMAEDLALGVYDMGWGDGMQRGDPLRDMVNGYNYVDPDTLPESAPYGELSSESHSFAEVFSGAFWDILTAIFNYEVEQGNKPRISLTTTANILGRYLIYAAKNAPIVDQYYQSIANTMVTYSQEQDEGKYSSLLNDCFSNRNILTESVVELSEENETIVLNDHLEDSEKDENPLYKVELEVPKVLGIFKHNYRKYKKVLDRIHRKKLVCGREFNTPERVAEFKVVDKKLNRIKFID
jgi:hypothetical protein